MREGAGESAQPCTTNKSKAATPRRKIIEHILHTRLPVPRISIALAPQCMHSLCMASTTISVNEEAYKLLKQAREKGQSFSDVIIGHVRPPAKTFGELLDRLEA